MMSSCLRSIPNRTPVRQATQADQVASLAEDGARASGWPLSVPWLRLSRQVAELRTLIEGFGDLVSVLDKANPKERAKVHADLGVTLTYRPEEDLVDVQAVPVAACTYERVGGASRPLSTRRS